MARIEIRLSETHKRCFYLENLDKAKELHHEIFTKTGMRFLSV